MRFTSQHKAINQKEYGKAVSPLRYDSLALILSWSIFVVYGKQSEKNKYFCSSKRHSALHTLWDTTYQMKKEAKAENRSLSNYIETLLYRMGYRPYNEETIKACEEARNGEFAGEVDTTNKSTIEASLFDDEA